MELGELEIQILVDIRKQIEHSLLLSIDTFK